MTESDAGSELLAIGSPGQSLRIHLGGPFYPDAVDPARRAWQRAVIDVEAHPFSGSIETIIDADGIAQYQQAIADLAATGQATLGGNRAAEIRLERDGQVIEVTVTPSGDDPWPFLRYLIFPGNSQPADAASLLRVRSYSAGADEAWAESVLGAELDGRLQARRGELHDVLLLPGFVAEADGERAGILTYRVDDEGCEIAVLLALRRQSGIGTALLDALREHVGDGVRLWVVTTNDNLEALRFYQRRGFVLRALRQGAVDEARQRLKPSIGQTGEHGIPLRDELELESLPEQP